MENYRLTEEEYNRILAFKRDLHMHPELSMKEVRTTAKIREFLSELPDFRILPLETESGTGVVAQICSNTASSGSGKASPAAAAEAAQNSWHPHLEPDEAATAAPTEIMLRADIDALPQEEAYESPWRSLTPGVMHACGHDFHTASLLGAALILQRAKNDGNLTNTVDLVFQPAEEGGKGAKMMISAGLFDIIHPSLCFGTHNWPSVPTGRVACHEGPLMAGRRNFEILIHGVSGHGSMPHLSVDPIVCAAAVIQSLQTVVSRNTDPLDSVLLSINMIEGGGPVNIIADHVRMWATVRSLSDAALDRAVGRISMIVKRTAEAYECRPEIIWEGSLPVVWNSTEMTALSKECAASVGCEVVDAPPSLASEDFACYRAHVPSFLYWVGSTAAGDTPEELHKPRFHTDDEALRHAAELYAASGLIQVSDTF